MNENFNLENCNKDDAISFDSGMYKAGKIKEVLDQQKHFLGQQLCDEIKKIGLNISPGIAHKQLRYSEFFEGIDCEILRVRAAGWQKGKFRLKVSLEFIPETSEIVESPLDDIRQEML
jgi:hypothetical protein